MLCVLCPVHCLLQEKINFENTHEHARMLALVCTVFTFCCVLFYVSCLLFTAIQFFVYVRDNVMVVIITNLEQKQKSA